MGDIIDSDNDNNSTTKMTQEVVESSSTTPEEEVAGDDKIRALDINQENHDVVRDVNHVIMWRRRKMNGLIMVGVTAVWVLLQVYGFKFTPIASWMAMAFATLYFFYASFLRLLHKEMPSVGLEEWEVTEERAMEMADSTKRLLEKGIRWMFRVSCEKDWYIFVAVVAALLLLANLGYHFDLLTLLYAGTMVGMIVPGIYVKKEEKIKAYGEKVKNQGKSLYVKLDNKVLSRSKLKHKINDSKKDHKVELATATS